jgi:diguanylate cyclase (GGDEF)-like protein
MNGARVLIVEDDPGVRRVLEFRLKASGHKVTTVENGPAAVQLLARETFDIVLTDLCMPEMNGIELLREVKRLSPSTQVIILTAYGTMDSAIEALRDDQAFDYIAKPVDIAHLNSRIQAALATQAVAEKTRSGRFKALTPEETDPVDPLTGFPDGTALRKAVVCAIGRFARGKQRFSIVMLDVDHFGYFSLLNGRREGEHLLAELASLIRQNIRKGDLVFRVGEDRFAILMPDLDENGTEAVADRLREVVANYSFVGRENQPMGRVTISVGISRWDGVTMDVETVIEEAVAMLEKAKNEGRNRTRIMRAAKIGENGPVERRAGFA